MKHPVMSSQILVPAAVLFFFAVGIPGAECANLVGGESTRFGREPSSQANPASVYNGTLVETNGTSPSLTVTFPVPQSLASSLRGSLRLRLANTGEFCECTFHSVCTRGAASKFTDCVKDKCASGRCDCEVDQFANACSAMAAACPSVEMSCGHDQATFDKAVEPESSKPESATRSAEKAEEIDAPTPVVADPPSAAQVQEPSEQHVWAAVADRLVWAVLILVAGYFYNKRRLTADFTQDKIYKNEDPSKFFFSLWGCLQDMDICCLAFFWVTMPVRWADNVDKLDAWGENGTGKKYWPMLILVVVLLTIAPFTLGLSMIVLLIVGVYYRQQLRKKENLNNGPMTCVGDCLTYCCFAPCAIVQESRQIEERLEPVTPGYMSPRKGFTGLRLDFTVDKSVRTVYAEFQPLGITFNREVPITVVGFDFNSYAKQRLGIQQGWTLTRIADKVVTNENSFKHVDKWLIDHLQPLKPWPLRLELKDEQGKIKTFWFDKHPLGIQFTRAVPLKIHKFEPRSYAEAKGVQLHSEIVKIGDEDITRDHSFARVDELLLKGLSHLPFVGR